MVNLGVENGQFRTPGYPKNTPPNLKNGPRGAKFPFSECQNYTDKSISQIPPGPPNRGSKPPGGGGHPPLHPLLPEKPSNLGGYRQGGVYRCNFDKKGSGGVFLGWGVKIVNFGVAGGVGGPG